MHEHGDHDRDDEGHDGEDDSPQRDDAPGANIKYQRHDDPDDDGNCRRRKTTPHILRVRRFLRFQKRLSAP